jgi:hypothetical protein
MFKTYIFKLCFLSQVKMENMLLRCECAAPFMTMLDPKQMLQFMAVLASLSERFNMPVLSETVEWARNVGVPSY